MCFLLPGLTLALFLRNTGGNKWKLCTSSSSPSPFLLFPPSSFFFLGDKGTFQLDPLTHNARKQGGGEVRKQRVWEEGM